MPDEPAPAPTASETPRPVDMRREAPAVAFMAILFLASIGLAMGFAGTFQALDVRAFEDPESLTNPLIYLGIVVVFTIFILLIAKYGKRILIKYIVLASVLITIYYVAWPFLAIAMGAGDPIGAPEIIASVLAVALTVLLWFFPEWYVIDITGVMVAAGAAGIFGISFGILPSLILLIAFATYDAIAVYRTKHMLSLADSVLELRLPIMFVVPKSRHYSFLEETRKIRNPDPDDKPERREAMFMGLGDAVIPAILVVSALTFLNPAVYTAEEGVPSYLEGVGTVLGMSPWIAVALATLAGAFVGFLALMFLVLKGNPQAGLPLLNGGAILGFLALCLPLYGLAPLNPFG